MASCLSRRTMWNGVSYILSWLLTYMYCCIRFSCTIFCLSVSRLLRISSTFSFISSSFFSLFFCAFPTYSRVQASSSSRSTHRNLPVQKKSLNNFVQITFKNQNNFSNFDLRIYSDFIIAHSF